MCEFCTTQKEKRITKFIDDDEYGKCDCFLDWGNYLTIRRTDKYLKGYFIQIPIDIDYCPWCGEKLDNSLKL